MPAHAQDGVGWTGQLAYNSATGRKALHCSLIAIAGLVGLVLIAFLLKSWVGPRAAWLAVGGRVGGHLPSRARFTPKPIAAMANIRPRIAISSAAITPHFPRCSGHMSNLSTAGAMPHSKPLDTKQPGPSAAYVPSSR